MDEADPVEVMGGTYRRVETHVPTGSTLAMSIESGGGQAGRAHPRDRVGRPVTGVDGTPAQPAAAVDLRRSRLLGPRPQRTSATISRRPRERLPVRLTVGRRVPLRKVTTRIAKKPRLGERMNLGRGASAVASPLEPPRSGQVRPPLPPTGWPPCCRPAGSRARGGGAAGTSTARWCRPDRLRHAVDRGLSVTVPTGAVASASPYVLKAEDDGYGIYRGRAAAAGVPTQRRPRYYDLVTADGVPYWQIGLMHLDSFASTVVQTCSYWATPDQCAFCGIELSLDAGRTIVKKSPAAARRGRRRRPAPSTAPSTRP